MALSTFASNCSITDKRERRKIPTGIIKKTKKQTTTKTKTIKYTIV